MNILNDIRHALRSLRHHPGFSAAVIVTLALGLGANIAIFSVVNGLLLKPLPYPESERLVDVHNAYPVANLDYAGTSIPDFLERRDQASALEDLALFTDQSVAVRHTGQPERMVAVYATPSLFSTLQVQPATGRVYDAANLEAGQENLAVLSHGSAQRLFGGSEAAVGQTFRLNGEIFDITGVMPADFAFPDAETAMWLPFAFTPEQRTDAERGREFSQSVGRLRQGATIDQLEAQLAAIVAANAQRLGRMDNPEAAGYGDFLASGGFQVRATLLHEQLAGDLRTPLLLLQLVTLAVLLIACANVANLMLVRVVGRLRELAVRMSMGAGRWRLGRQLCMEGAVLALIGMAIGLVLASGALHVIRSLGLDQAEQGFSVVLELPVVGFGLLLALVTVAIFSLLPMLALRRVQAAELVKQGGRSASGGVLTSRLRGGLVIMEMALAAMLLVGAGLLLKSFASVQGQDPGFQVEGLVTAKLSLPDERFDDDQRRVFMQRLMDEVEAIPGVTSAALVSKLPFTGGSSQGSYAIEGREGQQAHGHLRAADADYFQTIGAPLLQGRGFDAAIDRPDSPRAVIIDRVLADKQFANVDPIGQRISRRTDDAGSPIWDRIVGVVGTVKHTRLDEESSKETYYYYLRQMPLSNLGLVVRSATGLSTLDAALRQAIASADPEQPLFDLQLMDQRVSGSMSERRAPMVLVAGFAGLAILLAAIGIYSVLAYSVTQRTAELGIRKSLGADRQSILAMVLRQGMKLTAIGLLLGLLVAVAGSSLLQSLLFETGARDPLIFAAAPLLLAIIALVACLLPAWRAARINPVVALRHE